MRRRTSGGPGWVRLQMITSPLLLPSLPGLLLCLLAAAAEDAAELVASLDSSDGFGVSAARAVAAVHAAMGRPRPSSGSDRRPVGKRLCLWKLIHGECTRQDCKFSHDLADGSERDQLIAAVCRFWDGTAASVGAALDLVSSAAQVFGSLDLVDSLLEVVRPFVVSGGVSVCLPSPLPAPPSPPLPSPCPQPTLELVAGAVAPVPAGSGGTCLVDNGADEDFVGAPDWPGAVCKRCVPEVVVGTGAGAVTSGEVGDLGSVLQGAYRLEGSSLTLLSVGKKCETAGCGFTQDPGNSGARFWHPDHPAQPVECEPRGRLFHLPLDADVPGWFRSGGDSGQGCAGCVGAVGAVAAAAAPLVTQSVPAWYQLHCERGHPYDPRCDSCVRGKYKKRGARRKGDKRKWSGRGYSLSADFTGRHSPTVDGHTVSLVCVVHGYTDDDDSHSAEAGYGFVALLRSRAAPAVAEALDSFDRELAALGKDKSRAIVRFHTDVDKSFLGEVKRLAVRRGWAQTDTGGYRSQANGVVERRIGMLKQQARVVILASTGGCFYYDQLWGHALLYANKVCNANDWSDRLAPHTQLTGSPYVWTGKDHAFGELCV